MKTIEINEIKKIIDAAPIQMNLMFIGDTGIGKTQVISDYARKNNMYLKTLILSQIEASEALGVPVQSKRVFNGKEYNILETAIPNWVFDLAEHENSMLYLDEFLCAEPSVMNSFLNFLTEKKVGDIDLSHVRIVAATNIGNYTYSADSNILSRFCMFHTVNGSYEKYLEKKYKNINLPIFFDYKDTEDYSENELFEKRSLKPRCHEMLYMLNDMSMITYFYEGYTNKEMVDMFHSDPKINAITVTMIEKNNDENSGKKFKLLVSEKTFVGTMFADCFKKYKKYKNSFPEVVSVLKELNQKIEFNLENTMKLAKSTFEGMRLAEL